MNNDAITRIVGLLVCTLIPLSGCVPIVKNDSKKISSDFNIPNEFKNSKNSDNNTITSNISSASKKSKADWKNFFNDIYLHKLIDYALNNNQELNILKQEIDIARNEVSARKGEYLPKLGVGAGYEIEKIGEYTSQGKSDEALDLPTILHKKQTGLFASWELDIWKKYRNSKKSAYYSYLASAESRNFMVTQLVAEITSNYYKLLMLDEQLLVVKQYIHTLKQAQKVVEYQKEAARATSLAVNRFSAEVFKNYSLQYKLQQEIIVVENELNALLGRLPQPIERSKHKFLPLSVPTIHEGLPSELLENRPDIQQAKLNIKASELDVAVAKAKFYPSFSLDSDIGLQSFNKKYFLDTPTSLFYNVATNMTAPLLNRLAIEADYKTANNKQLQAVYDYQKTVINAYIEVVNQLNAIKNIDKTYSSKEKQVSKLNQSIDISNVLFKAARIDYLESLLIQRDTLEAQMDLIEIKQKQMNSYIHLYRALGGGWRTNKSQKT